MRNSRTFKKRDLEKVRLFLLLKIDWLTCIYMI